MMGNRPEVFFFSFFLSKVVKNASTTMPERPGTTKKPSGRFRGKIFHWELYFYDGYGSSYGLFTKQHLYNIFYIIYLPRCIGARALLRHCTVAASELMGLEHRSLIEIELYGASYGHFTETDKTRLYFLQPSWKVTS